MWSQSCGAAVLFLTLSACGRRPEVSAGSPQQAIDAPDLALREVAFVRLSEGRVEARGVAERLVYRRGGGRFSAEETALRTRPKASSDLASLGVVYLTAPAVDGDLSARRGNATGGVRMDSTRGDRARTQRIEYDGPADQLRTDTPVQASGPGYEVVSGGLLARGDGTDVRFVQGVSGQLVERGRPTR
jgi:hypothetical protein